jgi:hypothetical protein
VALVVILLVLLITTVLLTRFGREDFVHALTFPGRLTGAVLIAVAFTTLLGAAAVLDHWVRHCFPYSGLVALIGAFAAFLTNAMLLIETWKDGDSKAYPALFGALTAGSAWAAIAVSRTLVVVPAPRKVAVAVIIPSVVAVANFGYQNLYQPYQRETRPVITLSIGKAVLSKDRKAFAVPVDLTFQNHGDVGFYVLHTEFHAMGQRVPLSPKDRLRQQWRADAEQWSKSSEVNPLSAERSTSPASWWRHNRGCPMDSGSSRATPSPHVWWCNCPSTRRTTRLRSMPPRASRARTGSCCSHRSSSWRNPGARARSPDG